MPDGYAEKEVNAMLKRKLCLRRFAKAEEGNVMLIAALGLVAFLSIVSLVTDMGLKYYRTSQLQNAMDAAALAAVRHMPDEEKARAAALEYVEKKRFFNRHRCG